MLGKLVVLCKNDLANTIVEWKSLNQEHMNYLLKPIDNFLYQHFKLTGHSLNNVLVQPVEKLTCDKNKNFIEI